MNEQLSRAVHNYFEKSGLGSSGIQSISYLGSGVHGEAYEIVHEDAGVKRSLVLKSIAPKGFGHEYVSDRASVLIQAMSSYNLLPNHVKTKELISLSGSHCVSLGKPDEFYLLMEKAEGTPYFKDLDRILCTSTLIAQDTERAMVLAGYLAKIHTAPALTKQETRELYQRRIRDTLGSGECILGVIDEYPESELSELNVKELVSLCVGHWHDQRGRCERLRVVHGDFHPGNILFGQGTEFLLLDRSRGMYGEPADDLACIIMNYLMYYILSGRRVYEFRSLARVFLDEYLRLTGDHGVFQALPLFMFFRGMVVSNRRFFPEHPGEVRQALVAYIERELREPSADSISLIRSFDG